MRLIIACTTALLIASTATAQVPGQPMQPRTPRVDTNLMYGGSAAEFQNRLTTEVIARGRDGEPQSEERVSLIERIAPLVAEGRCNEARRIARDEGDRAVSRRVGQVCVEGRATPMPEAAAT